LASEVVRLSRSADTYRGSERVWGWLAALGAASAPVGLGLILLVLLLFAWPSVVWNGLGFFTTKAWNLGNLYGGAPLVRHGVSAAAGASYGMLSFLAGTVLSSLLALLLAGPIGVGIAFCLSEFSSRSVASLLGFFVELLAGVPSVVFGLWGFVVLVPWITRVAGPALASALGFLPIFRGPVSSGTGLLASGIVLGAMVLPVIAAVSRDAMRAVPRGLRDQGRALGLTDWEIARDLVWRVAARGVIASFVLALGRALGETMAVLMVSGNALNAYPATIFSPISTIASVIVALLDSAMTDATGMAIHALAELAVVLFVLTVAVNLMVPLIVRAVGEGRGWVNALMGGAQA
jgi:phosphate transport system permease protein